MDLIAFYPNPHSKLKAVSQLLESLVFSIRITISLTVSDYWDEKNFTANFWFWAPLAASPIVAILYA